MNAASRWSVPHESEAPAAPAQAPGLFSAPVAERSPTGSSSISALDGTAVANLFPLAALWAASF